MKQMTEQHMVNAFGGESMANMRYRYFALQAEKEGFAKVARLFNAISYAEYIHAGDHYRVLKHLETGYLATSMGAFGPGDTSKNLQLGIDGETFEVEEMYPAYMKVAEMQGEKDAYRSFDWSYQTEKEHLALYKKAKVAVDSGKDVDLDAVQVCDVCGYTLEGAAPEKCPVCGAKQDKFREFT